MTTKRWMWPVAGLMLALGLAARLWNVFAEPLWLDEAYSAFAADHDFAFLWQVVPRYETHPPFYYSLLHLWVLVAGDSVVALRLPGVIAGLATLPIIARAAFEAGIQLGWSRERRQWLMLGVVALACLSIPLVEMTRQVRPYPLMILAYTVALLALLRLAARARAGAPIGGRALIAHLLLVELLLWLHNLGPLYGVTLTLALAIAVVGRGLGTRDWTWLLVGHVAVALAYLPGFLILVGQAPTWVTSTWVRFDTAEVLGHLQMLYASAGMPALAAMGLAAMGLAACLAARGGRRLAAMLLVLATAPVMLSITLSITVAPVFITRTMTPVAVPALMLFALGAVGWEGWRRSLGAGLLLIVLLPMGVLDLRTRAAGPMENWYGAVDWLKQRFRPGDVIFAYPNEGALPLGYALRDKGLPYPVRPIPAPVPAFAAPGERYAGGSRGVVSLPPARLHAIAVDPATQAIPTIWLLRQVRQVYDPGDVLLRELHPGRRIVRTWRTGQTEIVGLTRIVRSPPAPAPDRR